MKSSILRYFGFEEKVDIFYTQSHSLHNVYMPINVGKKVVAKS